MSTVSELVEGIVAAFNLLPGGDDTAPQEFHIITNGQTIDFWYSANDGIWKGRIAS